MTQFNNGHALLVGVGADLPITIQDAIGLADFLKNPDYCAYPPEQVKLLTGAESTRKKVLTAFDELADATSEDDTVVVYFSGHGYVTEIPLLGKTYFLMPHGYDVKNLMQTAIQGREFADKLRAIPAKKILVLLDCCHAGGLDAAETKSIGVKMVKSSMLPESAELLAEGSGYIFIGSSREDELSYAGKPYSVFTYALLEALAGKGVAQKDGKVRVADISSYCSQVIPRRTEGRKYGTQHPVLNFEKADNFVVAYYAGGDDQPKRLPFPELEVEKPEAALQPIGSGATIDQRDQTVHGKQTNIGSITGNVEHIGDTIHHQSGGVNIDNKGHFSVGGKIVGGDDFGMSGDFRGAIVNVKSTLKDVTQTVSALPHGNDSQKNELERLLTQLTAELQKIPQGMEQQSQRLATQVEKLVEELEEEEPEIGKLSKRVKQAAEKLITVLPTALPLAKKIIEAVKSML